MFLDSFEAIYVINLRSRPDRRAEMLAQLARLGLHDDPRINVFEAIEKSDCGPFSQVGAHGCYLSHLSILELEAHRSRPILILEDDCDFRSGAAIYHLPQQWDIFYGGYLAEDPSDPQNSNIIGAHCMGYSGRAVKSAAAYLRSLLDPEFPPDAKASADPSFDRKIKPPFDGAIVWFRRAYPKLQTVFAQIAVQRASRSDITGGRTLDRLAPGVATFARRLKNAVRRLTD